MADETSSLVLKVDSTSAKTATRDLDNLTASSAKAEAAAGKLGTTSSTAARAVQAHGAATAAAATQAAELAETEEQAAKRIHDMVRASLAAVEANKANTAASTAATRATTEGAAASKALADAQTAQMQRWTALRAPVAEVQALLSKSKLTTTEVAKAEALLDAAQASGVITAGELAEAFAALDAAKIKDVAVTEAQAVANKTAGLNSRAQAEIATAASEVLSGNFGRLRRTGAAFANQAGLLTKLMSPMGLAILGVSGAVIALVAAYAKGEAEQAAFNKALVLTGNYAGQTVGQLDAMAKSLEGVGGATQHAAAGVIAQVVQSGKFFGDQIKTVATAALELQQTTGQAVDKTIADFEKLGKDPVHGILDLNQSMHFLTQATYDQVTALVQRGQTDKAAEVAQKAYADAVEQRAQDVHDNLGILQKAWEGITGAAKGAWDAMLDVGRPTSIDDKIKAVQDKLAQAQDELRTGQRGTIGLSASQINAGLQAQQIDRDQVRKTIADLQAQLNHLNFEKLTGGNVFAAGQSLSDRLIEERINAQQSLGEGAGASAQDKLNARLNDLAEQKAKALMGVVDPATRDHIIAQFNAQVAEAAQQFNSAEKKLNPTGPKTNPLSGLQGLVNSAGVSSLLVPNNQPVTEYAQTVAKITNAFDEARAKGADLGQAENLFAQGVAAANLKLKEQQSQIANGNERVFAQFKATLDDQIAAQKNAIDIQVASIGMGQKEAERLRELNQLDQQRIQQVQRLAREQITHPEQYAALQRQIDATNASFGDMRDTMIDGFHRMDAAQGDWQNGLTSALQDFIDQASDVAGQTRDLFTNAFNGMNDALANFVTTGKLNFGDLVKSIIADLAKMELRIIESKILQQIIGYFAGVGDNGSAGYASYDTATYGNTAIGVNAKGGVYDSPSLSRYSGGVYDSPRFFTFANGGVFGEEGPEAIMPLTRGSDGKLGVKAQGTGGGDTYNFDFTYNAATDTSNTKTNGDDQRQTAKVLNDKMKAAAMEVITRERQPGGVLWRDRVAA